MYVGGLWGFFVVVVFFGVLFGGFLVFFTNPAGAGACECRCDADLQFNLEHRDQDKQRPAGKRKAQH